MQQRRRSPVLMAITAVAVLALAGASGRAVWRIKQSADLARQSEPFQASPAQPVARLLIVGDSTGVGTGASSPAQSLAGLIAQEHPSLKIVNRAKDGAKFADISRQLEALGNQRFDAVLVLGGGNDVIRLTGPKALAKAWFPGGVTDPNLALVEVLITHAEYWDVKESKMVQVAKMLTAAVTGNPPEKMGEHKELRM